MRRIIYLTLNTCFILVSGKIYSQSPHKNYEVVLKDEIYIEVFDSSIVSNARYTANNKCYKSGNKLTYDYYYQDTSGRKFKFKPLEVTQDMAYSKRRSAWEFVSIDSIDKQTIDKISLTIDTNSNNILYSFPGFEQSAIIYDYLLEDGSNSLFEGTGLVENENNIWIHPPRDKMFGILELNPFPFILIPYEVGNKWNWTLNKVGDFWGDKRWKVWEGNIDIENSYEITDKMGMDTNLGQLECYEISAKATSPAGNSYLISYFNMEIGFIKLDYTNVDSSKLVLELIKIYNPSLE